jgi:hypothetical protein
LDIDDRGGLIISDLPNSWFQFPWSEGALPKAEAIKMKKAVQKRDISGYE